MRTLHRFSLFLGLLLFGTACGAQKSANDALRHDIQMARNKVYPALVNISVVVRYYNGGRAQRAPAGGSGVIVSKDGYVLTNYHVAGHTTRITCTLPDGEAIDARVVLHDPLTDLSILKLRLERRPNPAAPLPFAALGDSNSLQVGDYVLAMGNPLLLSSSMTLGIVSNTKRVFTDFTGTLIEEMELDAGEATGLLTRWIQHDALILPGNSGGPLVNLKGEVVGINELGGSGMGFAIPSAIAASVLKQALQGGETKRGWLGFRVLPVSKMGRTTGALISAVLSGSPMAKAGLAPGDILLYVNDIPVNVRFFEEVPLLHQHIAALPAGQAARLQYLHNGEMRTATATVAAMQRSLGKEQEYRAIGMTVQEITEPMALARRFPNREGVLVTGVRPGYPFETAKPAINPGDVILTVGDNRINDLETFRKVVAGLGNQEVTVTFRREEEILLTLVKWTPDNPTEEGENCRKPGWGSRRRC